MTKGKHSGRKTNKIVRMPATKFPKLQKKLAKHPKETRTCFTALKDVRLGHG
jgi:hypothetical protein